MREIRLVTFTILGALIGAAAYYLHTSINTKFSGTIGGCEVVYFGQPHERLKVTCKDEITKTFFFEDNPSGDGLASFLEGKSQLSKYCVSEPKQEPFCLGHTSLPNSPEISEDTNDQARWWADLVRIYLEKEKDDEIK